MTPRDMLDGSIKQYFCFDIEICKGSNCITSTEMNCAESKEDVRPEFRNKRFPFFRVQFSFIFMH